MAFKEGSAREEASESPAEERAEKMPKRAQSRYSAMREKGDMKMRPSKRAGGRGGKR